MVNTFFFGICIILSITINIGWCQEATDIDCKIFPGDGKFDLDDCCKMPELFESRLVRRCERMYDLDDSDEDSSEEMSDGILTGACAILCVFNETNLSPNGVLDNPAVIAHLENVTKDDPEWAPIIKAATTECLDSLDQMESNVSKIAPTAKPGKIPCNPRAGIFDSCLYTNMMKNCPASKYSDKKECNEMKQYVAKCIIQMSE